MSSIGQAVAGPRFYEMDDVRSVLFTQIYKSYMLSSGSTKRELISIA